MKHLKTFDSEAEQSNFRIGPNYVEPHVSCISDGTGIKYNRNKYKLENFWSTNGNTSVLPDKILVMDGNHYVWDVSSWIDTTQHPEEIPDYITTAPYYNSVFSTGVDDWWNLVDINTFDENMEPEKYIFFAWKINNPPQDLDGNNTVWRAPVDQYGGWSNYNNTSHIIKDNDDFYVFFFYVSD